MHRWHFVTSSFPPYRGGLGFYSSHLAQGLSKRGYEVYIWSAFDKSSKKLIPDYQISATIKLNHISDKWSKKALKQVCDQIIKLKGETVIVYRPNGFVSKNQLKKFISVIKKSSNVHLIFHKLFEQEPKFFPYANLPITISNLICCYFLYSFANKANYLYITSSKNYNIIKRLSNNSVQTIPVPSYITKKASILYARNLKNAYSGNNKFLFGTYSSFKDHQILPILIYSIVRLLRNNQNFVWVGFGRYAKPFVNFLKHNYKDVAGQMNQASQLSLKAISAHIQACDLMFQPFYKGVNTQRTSVMATLFHQVPLVTSKGAYSESIWTKSGCCVLCRWDSVSEYVTAIEKLSKAHYKDNAQKNKIAKKGLMTYNDHFCSDKVLDVIINNAK